MPTYQGPDATDPTQGYWLQDDGTMTMGPAQGAPNMSAAPPAPVLASQGAPSVASPGAPDAVTDAHYAAIDAINPAPPKPTMQTVGSSTTTQNGPGAKIVDPILANKTASANEYAGTVEQMGAARSERQKTAIQGEIDSTTMLQGDAAQERQDQQAKLIAANHERLALANQEDPKIDPNRFVSNMSTGKTIGTVILAALNGAFKSVAGQPGNDVTAILQKNIDEDIRAQQSQIENGKVRRNNLIAYYQGEGLDARAALNAAKAQALGLAAKQIELQAQLVGTPEAKEQGALLAAQVRNQQTQANDDLKLSLAPKSSTTSVRQLGLPPGTATPADPERALKVAAEMRKGGYTPEQVNGFLKQNGIKAPEGDAANPKFNRDQARLLATNEDAQAKLTQFSKLRGFFYNPKTDSFEDHGGGTNMLVPGALSSRSAEIEENAKSIAPIIGLIQGGGLKAHEPEVDNIINGLTSHSNARSLAALNQHWQALKNVIKGVRNYPSGSEQQSPEDESPQ